LNAADTVTEAIQTTIDDFLGGALCLEQPRKGVRAGADSVFLAASVQGADQGADSYRVLDVGTGTGVVAICLAHRLPGLSVDGLELQADLSALARRNATMNGMEGRVRIVEGNLAAPPAEVPRNAYDVVVSNPPYFAAGGSTRSPSDSRARARTEGDMDIGGWLAASLKFLKPRGLLSIVYRADRLDAVLSALQGRAGDIVVYPLWPRAGADAKTMIVQARKGAKGPLRLHPGLILHDDSGAYTAEADAVLRHGAALPM
jgi:tRNA1(Val) A37 N6-methylase TrmN6